MMRIIDRLFKRNKDFLLPFERLVVDRVISLLSGEIGDKLRLQAAGLRKAYRSMGGREVNLYPSKDIRRKFDDHWRISNLPEEYILATVYLDHPTDRKKLKSDVWLVDGWIFSLKFNCNPDIFFGRNSLDEYVPDVKHVRIWLAPFDNVETTSGSRDAVVSWLTMHELSVDCVESTRGAMESEIDELKAKIGSELPEDYLEIIRLSNGLSFDSLRVFGTDDVRCLVLDDANYWVLARSSEGDAVAVRNGDDVSDMYILGMDETLDRKTGGSFAEALALLA